MTTQKAHGKDVIVSAVAAKTGYSKKDVSAILESLLDVLVEELRSGNKVTFAGFGTFKTSTRGARMGVNPKTKEKMQIPATTVAKFTAGKSLKDAVK